MSANLFHNKFITIYVWRHNVIAGSLTEIVGDELHEEHFSINMKD